MPGIFSRRRDDGGPGKHVRWNSPLVTTPLHLFTPYGSKFMTNNSSHTTYWTPQPSLGSFASPTHNQGESFLDLNASPVTAWGVRMPPVRRSSFTTPTCNQSGSPFNRFGTSPGRTPFQQRNARLPTPRFTSSFVPPPAPTYSAFATNTVPSTPRAPCQTPAGSPSRAMPTLPQETPSLTRWDFPAGTLTWSPHPAPHPNVSAAEFWNTAGVLQGPQPTPRIHYHTPLDPWQAASISGGWPLPGSSPWWTPGTWPPSPWGNGVSVKLAPCLIPNPSNASLPQVVWDVAQNPARAQRITGSHTLVPLNTFFTQQATVPATNEVQIGVQVGHMERLWGPISVTSSKAITVWDLLNGIYTYLQTPLTQQEVDYLQSLDPENYNILAAACYARCNVTPSLPGYEAAQGLKRVDVLGDTRVFWGLWITPDDFAACWHLNLGLVNMRPGLPVR